MDIRGRWTPTPLSVLEIFIRSRHDRTAAVNQTGFHTTSTPIIDRIPAKGVAAIHEASMHLIETVGIRFDHPVAQGILADHGATVDDAGVVTMPPSVVEECIDRAPSEFTLHARNPDNDVTCGSGRPVRAPAYGPATVRRFDDGRRRARLADYEDVAKLAQMASPINCTGYELCQPTDVETSVQHLAMLKRSLELTDMPVMGSPYGRKRAEDCLELVGIAVDDPDLAKPYVGALVNTVPPRSLDRKMLGGLMAYARHGQPVIVSSFAMAGASAPASLAAALAQVNAENLAGITLAQLVNPGTPVVYGVPSSTVDSRYGSLAIGNPESMLFVAAAGQLARHYGLPSRAGGALTDAKPVDFQAGFESSLIQAATALCGIDMVLQAAGLLESYAAISPEKFVLDCEVWRYIDRFEAGFAIDADTLALDLMGTVDPADQFPNEDLGPARNRTYRSEVIDKRAHDDWERDGAKSAYELAHDRVTTNLEAYEPPALDPDTLEAMDDFVERVTNRS